jgi:hypothetical protein
MLFAILLILAVCAGSPGTPAAEKAGDAGDAAAIEAAVRDYIEGWFTSDEQRMKRALHPNLFKVTVRTTRDGEAEYLDVMEAEYLTLLSGRNHDWVKDKKGLLELKIIYQDERIAVVHAVSTGFYDVCGLVKLNGEWKILQVLWYKNERTE